MAVLDHIVEGSFTSDGLAKTIDIPCGFDFIEVENITQMASPSNGNGVKYRWYTGMAGGGAIEEIVDGSGNLAVAVLASNGFQKVSTGDPQMPGVQLSGSAISNASVPVASSSNTGGLSNGGIVMLYNVAGGTQFNGMQFTVDTVSANTSFHLAYAPQIVAATTFNYRILPRQPEFYPRRLFITKAVSSGTSTVVTLSVTHELTVGQRVVFSFIPTMYGMVQLSQQRGLITAVDLTNNTVTVDIDSSGFTAFAFPVTATAATAHTQPQLIPFGDGIDASTPLLTSSTLAGATQNTAINGVILGAGANGPAGQASDFIVWRALKAEKVYTS